MGSQGRPLVLYVCYHPLVGVAPNFRIFGQVQLIRRVADVLVVSPSMPADSSAEEREEARTYLGDGHIEVKTALGPFSLIATRSIYREAEHILASRPVDVIHGAMQPSCMIVRRLAKRYRVPVVTSFHGTALEMRDVVPWWQAYAKERVFLAVERWAARNAAGILFVSEAHRSFFAEQHGTPVGETAVLASFFDPRHFRLCPELREPRRRALDLEDKRIVIYVGSCVPRWTVFDRVARVMAQVCRARPDVHFMVLSREQKQALAFVQNAGLVPSQCTVTSVAHTEVPEYLNAADIGLLLREPTPTNYVASPFKFGEYVACGVMPVVSPHIGDLGRHIASGDLGLELTSNASAADEILAALDDPEQFTDERRRARAEWARNHWTWDSAGEPIIHLYQSILGGR